MMAILYLFNLESDKLRFLAVPAQNASDWQALIAKFNINSFQLVWFGLAWLWPIRQSSVPNKWPKCPIIYRRFGQQWRGCMSELSSPWTGEVAWISFINSEHLGSTVWVSQLYSKSVSNPSICRTKLSLGPAKGVISTAVSLSEAPSITLDTWQSCRKKGTWE